MTAPVFEADCLEGGWVGWGGGGLGGGGWWGVGAGAWGVLGIMPNVFLSLRNILRKDVEQDMLSQASMPCIYSIFTSLYNIALRKDVEQGTGTTPQRAVLHDSAQLEDTSSVALTHVQRDVAMQQL